MATIVARVDPVYVRTLVNKAMRCCDVPGQRSNVGVLSLLSPLDARYLAFGYRECSIDTVKAVGVYS